MEAETHQQGCGFPSYRKPIEIMKRRSAKHVPKVCTFPSVCEHFISCNLGFTCVMELNEFSGDFETEKKKRQEIFRQKDEPACV